MRADFYRVATRAITMFLGIRTNLSCGSKRRKGTRV
jgi:hypothetical protein